MLRRNIASNIPQGHRDTILTAINNRNFPFLRTFKRRICNSVMLWVIKITLQYAFFEIDRS